MSDTMDILSRLVQLDIDASLSYGQAIDNVEGSEIRTRLTSFRSDHERHITDLCAEITRLGGTPPERKRDLKGFVLEKFTAIRSQSGTEGALKAMLKNEQLTNAVYAEALMGDLIESTRTLIVKNREDERRHLQYLERVLEEKPWEDTGHRKAG